jgi:hypothetical protein
VTIVGEPGASGPVIPPEVRAQIVKALAAALAAAWHVEQARDKASQEVPR